MLVDLVHRKRGITAVALVLLGASALLLIAWPTEELVWASQVLHAVASGIIVPALAALTLSLSGHVGFSAQLGVNSRTGHSAMQPPPDCSAPSPATCRPVRCSWSPPRW